MAPIQIHVGNKSTEQHTFMSALASDWYAWSDMPTALLNFQGRIIVSTCVQMTRNFFLNGITSIHTRVALFSMRMTSKYAKPL
jgi:hypothetical protein